jgi:hypothetical protein
MPVYNDWEAAALVCAGVDRACERVAGVRVSVVLVDDGSSIELPAGSLGFPRRSLDTVRVVRLRTNVGHQRAIAIGLAHLYEQNQAQAVVVMDADGEDRPDDAVLLIERNLQQPHLAIFAARRRRLEGWVFSLGYHAYRAVHWLLTGIPVRIGNFSIIPMTSVGAVVLTSELWSHYAASVVKARVPMTQIPIDRGHRLAGRSTMMLVDLVNHGLSAISVFREVVGTRLLLAAATSTAVALTALAALVLLIGPRRLAADRLTLSLVILAGIIAVQGVIASFTMAFSVLTGRDRAAFLPLRDYHPFIASVTTVAPAADLT